MLTLSSQSGIDFDTENTKGTKDCRNGFFFAVFVFFVAKNPFDLGCVLAGSAGAVAADGFGPQNTPKTQKWRNLSGSLSGCFACSAVKVLLPCPAGKSGNSSLSRILWPGASGRFNPLFANPFQLNQAGAFPGFPGNFPGVYMGGG